jgi:dGTPase
LITEAIETFLKRYEEIISGEFSSTDLRPLGHETGWGSFVSKLKKYAQKNVYGDQKKVELELGAYASFECLLDTLCRAALDRSQKLRSPDKEVDEGWKSGRVLDLLGSHAPTTDNPPTSEGWSNYQCLRRVVDFVSGMTDNYAVYIAKQLQGMGHAGTQRP